jgi:DNA-binding winged helix-turn-helix (wHTH) protein
MEVGSRSGACVEYDVHGGRLILVTSAGRHEIHVRPQVHRLVRFMAERNAASAGTAVLCSNDELMHAVWGDEPMHTHTELARLVWELRRELEPLGATEVVVNERRRGYRLATCAKATPSASAGDADGLLIPDGVSDGPSPSHVRWILAVLVALVAGLAGLAVILTRDSGGGPTTEVSTTNADIGTFVDRIENVLEQSAAGRREIRSALNAGFSCSISPDEAARRISSVADNRQSILEQLGSLQTPTAETGKIVTLLQRALQQSIEADRHYRDGFLEVQAGTPCPLPSNPSFGLAATSDKLATVAKRRFVAAFDSLARAHGRPTWSAGGF